MFVSIPQVFITFKLINLLKIYGRVFGLAQSRETILFHPSLSAKKPGMDELSIRNSPCCRAHNLWFSVLRTSFIDASAVGTSLDNTIQPAAEGNHGPQEQCLMPPVQHHSQIRHQLSWKVAMDQ